MHEEIKKHLNNMDSKEKERFSLNTPVSEKEKKYCVCRTAYSENNHPSPMAACNACDGSYQVDCINFTHAFIHAVPFFVCPDCIDMSFGGYFLYIRHQVPGMIDLKIKDITEICKKYSSLNSLTQKLIKFPKYPS